MTDLYEHRGCKSIKQKSSLKELFYVKYVKAKIRFKKFILRNFPLQRLNV